MSLVCLDQLLTWAIEVQIARRAKGGASSRFGAVIVSLRRLEGVGESRDHRVHIRSSAAENDGLLARSRASAVLVVSGYEGAWMGVG